VLRAAALPRAVCRIVSSHVIVQQERKSKKGPMKMKDDKTTHLNCPWS
jgi:hypothetical protein